MRDSGRLVRISALLLLSVVVGWARALGDLVCFALTAPTGVCWASAATIIVRLIKIALSERKGANCFRNLHPQMSLRGIIDRFAPQIGRSEQLIVADRNRPRLSIHASFNLHPATE